MKSVGTAGIVDSATRYLFFTGKGGVGKTSASCASAVALADRGRKVLLVSTDPASNIDEVFAQPLTSEPTAIAGADGLFALNINPEMAAHAYREKVVGPYRGVLPDAVIASMEEQLSGACTVEIAAFDEFARLIGNPEQTAAFDHVIFDTAPTGHTLRLLSLPAAWSGFISESTAGVSCLGPLQGLAAQKELYGRAMAALTDANSTILVLVSRPADAPLAEAARSSVELAKLGIKNQQLVLNGIFRARRRDDALAVALEQQCQDAIRSMPEPLRNLARTDIDLKPRQLIGLDPLRQMFRAAEDAYEIRIEDNIDIPQAASFESIVDGIARQGCGVVMTMGKGGVGKSTIARRIACELSRRGLKVHMTTTDPAGNSLADSNLPPEISVDRIDPRVEVERYRKHVLATTGRDLDTAARALLEEDLASPCTEEIAIFQAFAAVVDKATNGFVVLDTAPTGHTILLLDAAQSFSREVSRQSKAMPGAVTGLLPRLRDPNFTHVVLCTLAEATPVHEAAALQKDLRRAGIEPYAWVASQCLTGLEVKDPLLLARQRQESNYLREIAAEHANLFSILPMDINLASSLAAENVGEPSLKAARGHANFA